MKENKIINSNKDNNEQGKTKNYFIYLDNLEKRARYKLIKRYEKPIWFYNLKAINNILYNEKTHYVEMFKEFLIYEDYNEFLKQLYTKTLLRKKLEKILLFYEKYSKIFPNYTILRESKYLYKNIKKKQKVINQMNENKINEDATDEENNYKNSSYDKTIFNSRVINSIYNESNSLTVFRVDSNYTNNNSIDSFINKISLYEQKKAEQKNNRHKKKKKEEKKPKNEDKQILFKKISDLLLSSQNNNNQNNNSFVKNKQNKDSKKSIIENNINNVNVNNNNTNYPNKLMIKYKQKSFSNIAYYNKKICSSIKHTNLIKKSNNINNIFDFNNPFNKKINNNTGIIFNNINNSYRTSNIKYYLDNNKYKKNNILSTNNTSSQKILTERVFSSPGRGKDFFINKKQCISNSKKSKNNKIKNNNNYVKRNFSSNILNKIQRNITKNSKKILNRNSNYFREDKKIYKCQINKPAQKKLITNYNPDSINKLYSNNLSNLKVKNKNSKNNNTFFNGSKNKIINNYNIMNGIMNNSTQINIYTGNDLIKSLHLYLNSIIHSTKSPPSPLYDNNLSKKKNNSKSLSKNNNNKKKKNVNLKKFIEKHLNKKNMKEPYTERNANNEKFLKLLDIYCRDAKKFKSTNIKKNINKNKLNKSQHYNSKSNLDIKSMGEANKKTNNNNKYGNLMLRKKNYYNNSKNIK